MLSKKVSGAGGDRELYFERNSALRSQNRRMLMRPFVRHISNLLRSEDGPTAVEYAVMLALIIVVCLAAISTMGGNANNVYSNVALNTAVKTSSS